MNHLPPAPKRRQWMMRSVAATAGLGGLGAMPAWALSWPWSRLPDQVLRPARTIVWKDFLGVNVQFQWFPPEVAARHARVLKDLDLQWVRMGLHWMLLEPKEGQFDLQPIDSWYVQLDETPGQSGFVLQAGIVMQGRRISLLSVLWIKK